MKRVGWLLDAVLDRENLRLAFAKASRGNHDHPEVLFLRTHLDDHLSRFAKQGG